MNALFSSVLLCTVCFLCSTGGGNLLDDGAEFFELSHEESIFFGAGCPYPFFSSSSEFSSLLTLIQLLSIFLGMGYDLCPLTTSDADPADPLFNQLVSTLEIRLGSSGAGFELSVDEFFNQSGSFFTIGGPVGIGMD